MNRNLLGVILLCTGILVFSLQDVVIKAVSGEYAVTEAIAIRSLVSVPILLAVVQFESGIGSIFTRHFAALALRAIILFVSYLAFYLAFPALPLADAIALWFTVPLIVTALAGPVLKEHVPLKAWLAVGLGLAGTLVMLQPGTGFFKPAALLSFAAAFFYSSAMLMARHIGATERASVMALYQNAAFLVSSLILAAVFGLTDTGHIENVSLDFLMRPWIVPPLGDFLLMASCGIVAAAGSSLLTAAYQAAQANIVTPFEYSGLLWTPLWGFVIWHEIPSLTTVLGAAIIVGAGLWSIFARQISADEIAAPP